MGYSNLVEVSILALLFCCYAVRYFITNLLGSMKTRQMFFLSLHMPKNSWPTRLNKAVSYT